MFACCCCFCRDKRRGEEGGGKSIEKRVEIMARGEGRKEKGEEREP